MSDTSRNEATVVTRRTHRAYSLEFKQQIVMETLQPGTSVSAIARKHDINDNLVFDWRRRHRLGKLGPPATIAAPLAEYTELLPVSVIEAAPPEPVSDAGSVSPVCEVEIEVGTRRVRIRGLSMDRAERFLRECLQ